MKIRRLGKPKAAPLGYIEKLVLENFKSYEGLHEIGPFDKFTCIIGPNGSGKSNIMDAISFVLGISAKHLRSEKLKDMVYRREEEEGVDSNKRSAKVVMVFRMSDGEALHFARSIDSAGRGTYSCGPPDRMRNMSYDDFIKNLSEQRINVKARNFLVFQGDVMELARRQGTDLTGVLEAISGSESLKDEYVRLSRELELCQEKARMHFQHRREIESAVSLLDRQRADMQRYQELRSRRDCLVLEVALFKLFCVEREADRAREEVAGLQGELQAAEGQLRARRREAEEAEEARKKAEVESEKATSQHFVLTSNLEQLRPEIGQCHKQAAHWERKLKEKEAQINEERVRQRGLASDIESVRRGRADKEAELSRLRARPIAAALRMTEAQRVAFEACTARADASNARAREQLREAEEQLAVLARELAAERRDLADLEGKRGRAAAKLEDLKVDHGAQARELEGDETAIEQCKAQIAKASEEVRKFDMFKESLSEEHRSLRTQLDSAQARRERLDEVEAKQRIADELRGLHPAGVVGRLSELVLPTQKRFDLPLQRSLGSNAEAFVVTTSAVARECVAYLKVKRIPTETFLPLDRMSPSQVGPLHLLTQDRHARHLATKCVQHNEKFLDRNPRWLAQGPALVDKTMEILLNNTVIVDDLEEARETAYRDARRRKLRPRVVTLGGEVISPNGDMSVHAGGAGSRSVEFGGADLLQDIKSQEQKLQRVEKDLATLRTESAKSQQRVAQARREMEELQAQLDAKRERLKAVETARASEQKLLLALGTRAEEIAARVSLESARQDKLQRAKDGHEADLLKTGRQHFAALSAELGVEDVRELVMREQRERRQLRLELEELEDAVRALLGEEQSLERRTSGGGAQLEALEQDCAQHRREIEENQRRRQDLEAREKAFVERVRAGASKVQEANRAREAADQAVKVQRTELQRQKVKADEAKRKIKGHNEKARVVLSMECAVLRDCSDRHVEVPLLSKDDAALERVLSRAADLDDLPFQELEDACSKIRIDFSGLPDARKEMADQTNIHDTKVVESEYEAEVVDIMRELEDLSPNMKAQEELASEEQRLRDICREADESSREADQLARRFEEVKTERVSRFMKCFKHVETKVHPYYRELTSYDGFDGGSAYLDLDDTEEPYNGGITFTACPPGKRFFPMELLSGGERSMASMALLFAMHSYQPPPFMILDEVDAPFDRKNTGSLVNYLKKLNFQCLVISLKDTFFSHSDSIVGIYKDKELQTSGSLSLPLQRLGEESQAVGTQVPAARAIAEAERGRSGVSGSQA